SSASTPALLPSKKFWESCLLKRILRISAWKSRPWKRSSAISTAGPRGRVSSMQLVSGGAWRKYFKVAEISFTNRIVYLADHFASSIFLILILFIFSQLWKTVLGPSEEIAGLNSTAMLWYMLFTEMIALSTPRTHQLVSEDVKSGGLAYKLVRPCSYILYYFAVYGGGFIIRAVTNLT